MSIENNLASIAQSLATIADHLTKSQVAHVTPAPVPVATPAHAPVAPVVQPDPVQSFAPAPAPTPTPAPTPAPAPVPQVSGVPFSDAKGLIGYVMETYKALGPAKGAQIQTVLSGLGYQNINEVKPESYAALYAGIEALK